MAHAREIMLPWSLWLQPPFKLFDGDLLLTKEQIRTIQEKSCFAPNLWPKSSDGLVHVYYAVQSDVHSGIRELIPQAMRNYNEKTCIRLDEVSLNTREYHLRVRNSTGCSSHVGLIKGYQDVEGHQFINLAPACYTVGTVVHEFGHALGMNHEQSRPDRDEYIFVNIDNVVPEMRHNYDLRKCNTYGVPYNYYSVMQYRFDSFSAEGAETMVTKDILRQTILGENDKGLSHYDELLVNRAYGCIGKTDGSSGKGTICKKDDWLKRCRKSKDPCMNDGYLGPDCRCVCPRGTEGTNCERKTGDYYPPNPLNCGGEVTTETLIATPKRHERGACIWLIKAPRCHQIQFTIKEASFYKPENCRYESITLRIDDIYKGKTYCRNGQLREGQVFHTTKGEMAIHWNSRVLNGITGLQADVKFIRGRC